MRSETKGAQKVRHNYITLKISRYRHIQCKDHLISKNKKIKILKRNLKKIKYPFKMHSKL